MPRSGGYARSKGNRYELKIIKELIALGFPGLVSSRSESKNLDNAKVDIADPENSLKFYIQCKCTKSYPNYNIINDFTLKDKPLVIFHNKQINKKVNMGSSGEFVILTFDFFKELLSEENSLEIILKETKNTPSYDKLITTDNLVVNHKNGNNNFIIIKKSMFYKLID